MTCAVEPGKGIRPGLVAIMLLLALGGLLLVLSNIGLGPHHEQQFVHLAGAFLDGRLHFTEPPSASGWADTSPFEGRHYWPLGPFPAVLLMPFVALAGSAMQQGLLSPALTLLSGFLTFRICRRVTGDPERALWLTFASLFGTAYLFVALLPWSWYFAHVVSTALLLLAIDEHLGRNRPWLSGAWIGLAAATRISLVLAALFFVLQLWSGREGRGRRIAAFCAPLVLCGVLLAAYNLARFGDPAETGYSHQIVPREHQANRERGLWSLEHVPANVFYLFLRGPEPQFAPGSRVLEPPYLRPDPWGMSIALTSPILLWLARFRRREGERVPVHALLAAAALLAFTLGNFGIGARQYGYRFALDFAPFLIVTLAHVFRDQPFGRFERGIVVATFLFNAWMIPRLF